jgi:hypothetical protein
MRRLKIVGGALGLAAMMGAGFWFEGLDASVETRQVPGTVTAIGPYVGKNSLAVEQGLTVDVKLEDGRLAHVMALKTTDPHVGQHVEIAEHKHGSGRTEFSWR